MRRRRIFAAGLTALLCAALAATAAAATSEAAHLPGFSFVDQRVAVKKLPFPLRISLGGIGGRGLGHRPIRGAVWFGEVERPGGTILAAGDKSWVCVFDEPTSGGGGGICGTDRSARELGMVTISQVCGRHRRIRTRISGLVPNGVTGLAIERKDGTIGRTIPVHENTVSFPIGSENVVLQGVGNAAAEGLEKDLPLDFTLSPKSCVAGGDYFGGEVTTEPAE